MNLRNNLNLKGLLLVIIIVISLITVNVFASIEPSYYEPDGLHPGDDYTVTKNVTIPILPPKVDVMFAFELDGPMGGFFETAKTDLSVVMAQLDALGIDFTYGLISYMDYPSFYRSCDYNEFYSSNGDYAYNLDQPLTSNSSKVDTVINSLLLGDGWDLPECYTRIFYESYADSSIGWRNGSKKLLVNFGDNIPHDCNISEGVYPGTFSTGRDPGRDEEVFTDDDLDLQLVLADMAANNTMLLQCQPDYYYAQALWDYWTGITGGSVNVINTENFATDVVNTITDAITISSVFGLHLEVTTSGYESWLTSVVPASYDEVAAEEEVPFEETVTIPLDADPEITHTFVVSALDEDGVSYGDQTNVIVLDVNVRPNEPVNPNPPDNADGVDINPTLSVNVSDSDGDVLNVTFFDASDDSIIGYVEVPSGGVASINWYGLAYLTEYNWYVIVNDSEYATQSVTWSFTTVQKPAQPPKVPSFNENPVADASAGAPYNGFIGTEIVFDGSLSYDPDLDGYITNWIWNFGDGANDEGEITTHKYTKNGTYTATLKVVDNEESSDIDTFEVIIAKGNNPPENLQVDGSLTGKKNISYSYTASATDIDPEDRLRFTFNWDDGTNTTSEVVESGEEVTLMHSWSSYGVYEVKVTAIDNSSSQISTTFIVLIDVIVIDGEDIKGYLVDEDSTDPFDIFDNTQTGGHTVVEKEDSSYLIDSNGDGDWDHAYNPDTGVITYFDHVYHKYLALYQQELATPGFELVPVLIMFLLVAIILKWRRKES